MNWVILVWVYGIGFVMVFVPKTHAKTFDPFDYYRHGLTPVATGILPRWGKRAPSILG
jgi:hypothetical protein